MRNTFVLLVALFAISCASKSLLDLPFGDFQEVPHHFGGSHFKRHTPAGSESIVYFPENGLFGHPEHFQEVRQKLINSHKGLDTRFDEIGDPVLTCAEEQKADFLKIIPTYIATMTPSNSTYSYSAPCYRNNTLTLNVIDNSTVELIHVTENPSSFSCADTYFYSTLQNFHFDSYLIHGTHKVTFKVTPDEFQQILTTGIFVFRTCDKLKDIIPDLFKTVSLFLGEIELAAGITTNNKSIPTAYDEKQSIEFTYEATGYQWKARQQPVSIDDLDESLVNSGDFFAVKKFDGTGDLVEYGTGSHVNHATVALRVNGTLYIAESNSNFEWPVGGIQMNPYKTWMAWAKNQGYCVTWLPLKAEYAQKFDSDAAYAWFKTVEGLPYGIHNYIYGWLDTPNHSFPPLMSPEFLASMFALLEKSKPDAVYLMFTLGLNKRLGTTNLTVAEIAEEAWKRGLTMPDLYAIVEQDGWEYPDGLSYVCSGFVAGLLKAAGMFGDSEINAVEFTPKDIYQLVFYDPAPVLPENCKMANPGQPFCQLMGKYQMDFPNISTVNPYSHMNEACWTEPPLYERIPLGC